jgi:hypothetical protein
MLPGEFLETIQILILLTHAGIIQVAMVLLLRGLLVGAMAEKVNLVVLLRVLAVLVARVDILVPGVTAAGRDMAKKLQLLVLVAAVVAAVVAAQIIVVVLGGGVAI